MTANKLSDVDRLSALIDRKLGEFERRKKAPSLAELNGVRRLVEWRDGVRELEEARRLTRDSYP